MTELENQHNVPLLPEPQGSLNIRQEEFPPDHSQHNSSLLPPTSGSGSRSTANSHGLVDDAENVQTHPDDAPSPHEQPENAPPQHDSVPLLPPQSDPALPTHERREDEMPASADAFRYDAKISAESESGGMAASTDPRKEDNFTHAIPESKPESDVSPPHSQSHPHPTFPPTDPGATAGVPSAPGANGALSGKIIHVLGIVLGSERLKAKGAMKMQQARGEGLE
ncbi:hypothetical protein C8F01DRAFT_509996 [Mycena amicta]|nr:hypothetical protein C8F01DRAFT_509996 [Mycena amicta]